VVQTEGRTGRRADNTRTGAFGRIAGRNGTAGVAGATGVGREGGGAAVVPGAGALLTALIVGPVVNTGLGTPAVGVLLGVPAPVLLPPVPAPPAPGVVGPAGVLGLESELVARSVDSDATAYGCDAAHRDNGNRPHKPITKCSADQIMENH
jgi:hypothetical protein